MGDRNEGAKVDFLVGVEGPSVMGGGVANLDLCFATFVAFNGLDRRPRVGEAGTS